MSQPALIAPEEPGATSRLVIPPAAFTPFDHSNEYSRFISGLVFKQKTGGGDGVFTAPVNLPHGATMTQVTFYWNCSDANASADVYLQRGIFSNGSFINIAHVHAFSGTGYHFASTITGAGKIIDNSLHAYWMTVVLPETEKIALVAVAIDYIVPSPPDSGILSIPTSAFWPFTNGYDYENHGRWLLHDNPAGGFYIAPLNLPDGAVIKKITLRTVNNGISINVLNPNFFLQTTTLGAGNYSNLVSIASDGTNGYMGTSTSPSGGIAIDYLQHTYWLTWAPPAGTIYLMGAIIEYTPPTTVKRRITIPGAAFNPVRGSSCGYENHGRYTLTKSGSSNTWSLIAPVNLPHGSYVTGYTVYYRTNIPTSEGIIALVREANQNNEYLPDLVRVTTPKGVNSNWHSIKTTLIRREPIDNNNIHYQLQIAIPLTSGSSYYQVAAVVIEYSPIKPTWLYLSIIRK